MAAGVAAGVAVLLCVAGCASYSTRLGASTIAPGQRRAGAALDGIVYERGREHIAMPAPELFVRWGMGPRWDLGFSANMGGAEASARWQLVHGRAIALAVAPTLGGRFALATNNATDVLRGRASIRVLVEARASERVALIAGLKPDWVMAAPVTLFRGVTASTRLLFEPGVMLGARIDMGHDYALWPEINMHIPYDISGEREALIIQGGVALSW